MTEMLSPRTATDADASLLFALFAEQKAAEMAPLGLSSTQLQPLLDMQYRGRELTYAQAWPSAANLILCLPDGTPAGRLLLHRQPESIRILDLAVLAQYQRRGIGSCALRMVQRSAAEVSTPVHLRVVNDSRARRLYERLGFRPVAGDALSCEMQWLPQEATAPALSSPANAEPADGCAASGIVCKDLLHQITAFLQQIGLRVETGPLPSPGFLPGIQMIRNGLRVDPDALLYPGDLLHEAGHLAVMPPERRNAEKPSSSDPAEEMASIAWSWAAAIHLGIPAEVVFHEHGYRGQASMLAEGFARGQCPGLPMLWWLGLTTQPQPGCPSIFPRMRAWLREKPEISPAAHQDSPAIKPNFTPAVHEAHA